jgi:hypothetical protein
MCDFHVAKLKTGELVFCSLMHPITKAARFARAEVDSFYDIQGDQKYQVGQDDAGNDVLLKLGTLRFGSRSAPSSAASSSTGYNYGSRLFCYKHSSYNCNCTTEERAKSAPFRGGCNIGSSFDKTPAEANQTGAAGSDHRTAVGTAGSGGPGGPVRGPVGVVKGGANSVKSFTDTCVSHIGAHGRRKGVCASCMEADVDRKRALVCPECMKAIEKAFEEVKGAYGKLWPWSSIKRGSNT